MHPLIRILCFMVFALFVSLGGMAEAALGLLILIVIWYFSKTYPNQHTWNRVKRLRLFFISIMVIYLWFTPGELLVEIGSYLTITYEGVFLASQRITALVLLVISVDTLLRSTSRNELVSGLYFLAKPFNSFGFDTEKMVIRVLLTMEFVFQSTKPENETKKLNLAAYVPMISNKISSDMLMAIKHDKKEETICFNLDASRIGYQWIFPLGLFCLFLAF